MKQSALHILFSISIIVVVLFSGCSETSSVANIEELNAWMKNAEELTITRSVNGVEVKVKYILPIYSAFKDLKRYELSSQKSFDSLLTFYDNNATFIMTLGPDETTGTTGDIMYKGVKNFKEYVLQAKHLNFDLEKQVSMETNEGNYYPALSSLDNTYSLTSNRNINFVFSPTKTKEELKNAKHFQFVYDDEVFELGTLHFYFDKEKIDSQTPKVSI